jgi:RNA polymerase sigma-70 factor (ECF subfamily)
VTRFRKGIELPLDAPLPAGQYAAAYAILQRSNFFKRREPFFAVAYNEITQTTSETLLLRLRDADDTEAWREFVDRYAPKIYSWCLRYRLQESDASDVTQNVLCKLVGAMRTFKYDPAKGSFRGWLKTVTANAVRDLMRAWDRQVQGAGDTQVLQHLASIQDPRALAELRNMIESEYEMELLREAEQRVRLRVKPHTWEAYRLTAVEQIPSPEAARQLNMPVAEVYVAKSRVIKLLRGEVQLLAGQDNDAASPPAE